MSIHLPDGDSFTVENFDEVELAEFSQQQSDANKANISKEAKRKMKAQELAILAELFEERIEFIVNARGNQALPTPFDHPGNFQDL